MKKRASFWQKSLLTLTSLSFLGLIAIAFLYIYLESELPDVESLNAVHLQVPLHIYTQDGLLIQEYGEKRRIPVTYNEIPPMLVKALLATEDQRFFEHPGVDIWGLGRALISVVQTGSKSQGGSTITMQVARNFFLTRKKTFLRKFNEILLAIKIDKEFSKQKILELYLNRIYLGNRAYGVGAAAQIYYGKTLSELTLGEIAMIAGLPQAPSVHNPIANPKAAKIRRDHVLDRLLEEHYISQKEHDDAVSEPIEARYHGSDVEVDAPYVAEMVRQSLYQKYGDKAYTEGYKVYTTLNGKLQKAGNEATFSHLMTYDKQHGYRGPKAHIDNPSNLPVKTLLTKLASYPQIHEIMPAIVLSTTEKTALTINQKGKKHTIHFEGLAWAKPALRNGWVGHAPNKATDVVHAGDIIYIQKINDAWTLSQIPDVETALVSLNPHNGAILALVGGFNFYKSKFNRATQSIRQPGSSFKPFIYAAALNKGYTLATLINDAPLVINDPSQPDSVWRPHNVNRTFNGPMRLKEALAQSRNLVSIRILDDIGIDYATHFITPFGFSSQTMPKTLSLALGSLSVTPLDLTSAYATFANNGYKIAPYFIEKITDNDGKVIFQADPDTACNGCLATKKAERIISEDTTFLIVSAMQEVIQHGTGKAAKSLNRPDFAGKTGTTNDQVDAWFVGFNPDIVTSTWMGYDAPLPLHQYAASLALPIWIDFMKPILHEFPEKTWLKPDNIIAVRIDPISGLLAQPNQADSIIEYFKEDQLPAANESSEPQQAPAAGQTNAPVEEQSLF